MSLAVTGLGGGDTAMRRIHCAAIAAVVLMTGVAFGGVASATPNLRAVKPTATLTVVHSKINAGTAPSFKYSTAHLAHGTKLYLQRQFGTARTWKNVKSL